VPIDGWKLQPEPHPNPFDWMMPPDAATPLVDIMEFARQMQAQGMPFGSDLVHEIAGIERPAEPME
jgi:hypothetical protein